MSSAASSVVITGIGSYLPSNVVTNDDLALKIETSDEWIRTRTKTHVRLVQTPTILISREA